MNEAYYKLKQQLKSAVKRLEEALEVSDEYDLIKDGKIQRFEFTFELSWKLMGKILSHNDIEAYGPKNIIREAGALRLIDDVGMWLELQKARNLASHLYDQAISDEVLKTAHKLPALIHQMLSVIDKFES